jgi:hypothetical protein
MSLLLADFKENILFSGFFLTKKMSKTRQTRKFGSIPE